MRQERSARTPTLVAGLVTAYLRGMQRETLGPESVACMTKHFPGGGPQLDGEDPHFPYGREQVYPGGNFDYHLIPFAAAIEAGTAQVMPYYGMPVGTEHEEVGFGFNHDVITGLLRERYGFDGVVCSDWGLLTDAGGRRCGLAGTCLGRRAPERARSGSFKALDAGVDQFGGEAARTSWSTSSHAGRIERHGIDASVRRLLRDKFRLGLFDDPYVDPQAAGDVVGQAEFRRAGARRADALHRAAEERPRDPASAPAILACTSRGSTRPRFRRP